MKNGIKSFLVLVGCLAASVVGVSATNFGTPFPIVSVGTVGSAVVNNFAGTLRDGTSLSSSGAVTVWTDWTAGASGSATITTDGSTFDTLMIVFTGADLTHLVLVGQDDNSGANGLTSKITFNAVSGTTYHVAITGVNGGHGTLKVSVSLTVSGVSNQTINEDSATAALALNLSGLGSSITLVGTAANTALVPNANIVFGGSGSSRTVSVTPAADANGSTTITITATDTAGLSTVCQFGLTVTPVNDAPVANNFTVSCPHNYQVVLSSTQLLSHASDVDGDTVSIYHVNTGATTHGTVTGSSPSWSYAPSTGYSGSDSFAYTVTDGHGAYGNGTVTVNVQ